MDPIGNKMKGTIDLHSVRLYDYIPVNAALIEHVRKLDGFNDKELVILKQLLIDTVNKINQQFKFEEKALLDDPYFKKFIETTMKVHQILALVDVKYDSIFPVDSFTTRDKNLMAHFHEVAAQMQKHQGLNYVPRERSIDGRVFEHAADCKVLVDLLSRMPGLKSSGQVAGYRPPQ